MLDSFFIVYLIVWSAACLAAILLMVRRRAQLELFFPAYWRFLATPWKLFTFALATAALIGLAPYTGDPTWDAVDASFMAALTFATAPWSLGVLYRGLFLQRHRRARSDLYIALCLWLFSASWSYDLYLLWRDGEYPHTWAANIAASSILYVAAGLLWNLHRAPGRGIIFAFMAADWPPEHDTGGFWQLLPYALPFILLVAVLLLSFVF